MDHRIRLAHLCAPPPFRSSAPGTVWTCRRCRARYARGDTTWQQTKKPRHRIWAIIATMVDAIFNLP